MGVTIEEWYSLAQQGIETLERKLSEVVNEIQVFNANAETFMEAILQRIDEEAKDCQDK